MEVRVFRSLCLKNKLVSSAKMNNLANFDELTISLMYMIKSSGPRMDPWKLHMLLVVEWSSHH